MNKNEDDEPAATEDETRAALLDRSKRDFAPVNKLFVQGAHGSTSRHGPLATFVQNRDLCGLHAYLLLLGITSSGDSQDGWSTTLPIGVWARAFGTTRDTTSASAATAVSKVLTRLESRKLIQRQRHGRAQDPDHPAPRGRHRPALHPSRQGQPRPVPPSPARLLARRVA